MNRITKIITILFGLLFMISGTGHGADPDFYELEAGFKNFIQCELSRTDGQDYFKGKQFSVTLVNLFNVTREQDLIILTGTAKCDVQGQPMILYAAIGLKELKGKRKVCYCTIRNHDFYILATELLRFPYKERCPWTRYWINQQ